MVYRIAKGLFITLLAIVALVEIYAFVPVYITPLMIIRLLEGNPIHATWVPLSHMPFYVAATAIGAEDSRFCTHNGFDFEAINKALEEADGRGASTISQQTAKNVFLWPSHSWLRKGLEVPMTLLIENLWGKRRIMEVYLNVAEFGPGVYGIGAAAQRYFHTKPKGLTRRQAAMLVAVLPSPRHWSPIHPGPYVAQRGGILQRRAYQVTASCIRH